MEHVSFQPSCNIPPFPKCHLHSECWECYLHDFTARCKLGPVASNHLTSGKSGSYCTWQLPSELWCWILTGRWLSCPSCSQSLWSKEGQAKGDTYIHTINIYIDGIPYEKQTKDRSYLLTNVLIIGAQWCIKFESSLSQLMCMLQIMIQLQITKSYYPTINSLYHTFKSLFPRLSVIS